MNDLFKNLREMKSILYGNSESEPVAEACAQLTQEFFRENTLRLLIRSIPKLNLEVTQKVEFRIIGIFLVVIRLALVCAFGILDIRVFVIKQSRITVKAIYTLFWMSTIFGNVTSSFYVIW